MFRVFGIQLAVHASFFLLLAYYGYEGWKTGGIPGLGWSLGLIVLFFVCVILHELGHSLTARRFGVRVPRILLLPIGGMAEFDRIPRKPSQELLITVAGPAVNFVLVGILLPFVWRAIFSDSEVESHSLAGLGVQLCLANLGMGLFNLLPVFPMDGGRILRALLAMKLPYLRATWWAAVASKILAPILACVGYFYLHEPMLGVLFLFIFVVGDIEYRQTVRREEESLFRAEMAQRLNTIEPGVAELPDSPLTVPHGRN